MPSSVSRRMAQPLTASTKVAQAMRRAVKPIVIVKVNIASRLYDSRRATVSLFCCREDQQGSEQHVMK